MRRAALIEEIDATLKEREALSEAIRMLELKCEGCGCSLEPVKTCGECAP